MNFTPIFALQMLIHVLIKVPFKLTFKFKVHLKNNLTLRQFHSQEYHQTSQDYLLNEVQLTLLKYLPLRTISRVWGLMTSLYLPICLRSSVLGSYSRLFDCQLKEAEIDDYRLYPSLKQFFTRSLKPGLRPIAPGDNLVSPVDGTVLHFGRVTEGNIEQIKGVYFTVRSFLGPQSWPSFDSIYNALGSLWTSSDKFNNQKICDYDESLINYTRRLKVNPDNCLYNCVIYLAPGDYHRFHSPAEWKVHFRRHFPGHLLSVHPSFVGRVKGLFTINERVAYLGHWNHGFMSMTAVGATNVGSVSTYFDPNLKTNRFNWRRKPYNDHVFGGPIGFDKGDAFGEFNLGSTIVLLFEAPRNWRFTVQPGDKIKYGQLLFKQKSNQAKC